MAEGPSLRLFALTIKTNILPFHKNMYTAQEIEGADEAVALQQYIGWPGTSTYINYIKNNLIKNCPVRIADVQ